MYQNISGQRVDYETFKADFDANPNLQGLVQNFDSRGITLKTQEVEMPQQGQDKGTKQVDSMAKRATAKAMKR